MSNSIKQIYVSLQLGENDLKLLVAEYYNSRFNILKVEKINSNAINDFKVIDKNQLVIDIRNLVKNTSEKLGTTVEQAILIIPAYNFKRIPLRSKITPNQVGISKQDIKRAIDNSLKVDVDDDVMVINPMIVKYTINGLPSRRMPLKEICDETIVDIDLLCADKTIAYDYVECVEKAGLRVLDIVLNNYAICKESALIDESLKQNIIVFDIDRSCTYLSLLSKGKLVSSEVVFSGLEEIVNSIKLKYDIPREDIYKLIKYDVNYHGKYVNDVVYAYNDNNNTRSITQQELNDACIEPFTALVNKLMTMCSTVLSDDSKIIITGEGGQVKSLFELIGLACNNEIKAYYPETVGVRDPALTALYGALFAYRDKVLLEDLNVTCVDLLKYDSSISKKQFDNEGETITTKIKNLFKQYVEREEN